MPDKFLCPEPTLLPKSQNQFHYISVPFTIFGFLFYSKNKSPRSDLFAGRGVDQGGSALTGSYGTALIG